MSSGSSVVRHSNADEQEAQRAESSREWSRASEAHLRCLLAASDPSSGEVLGALAGLRRAAEQGAGLAERARWGLGLALCARWSEAEAALAPLPDPPLNLSNNMTLRWPQIRAQREGDHLPSWSSLLRLIDRLVSMGFPSEALTLAERSPTLVSSEMKRAVVLFEAGRLGVLHRAVPRGVHLLRAAIDVQPNLRPLAREIVDGALRQQRADGADLAALIELRVSHVEDVVGWARGLIEGVPEPLRAPLARDLGACAERALGRGDVALIFYQIALAEAESSGAHTGPSSTRGVARAEALSGVERLARGGLEGAQRALLDLFDAHGDLERAEDFLISRGRDLSAPAEERARHLLEAAQRAATSRSALDVSAALAEEATLLAPGVVDLRALIRQARSEEAWAPLDALLSLQLKHTSSTAKKQVLLRAQAQARRARGLEAAAYLALVGSLALGHTDAVELDLDLLLMSLSGREGVEGWLLREGAEGVSGWVDDVLLYARHLARVRGQVELPYAEGSSTGGETVDDEAGGEPGGGLDEELDGGGREGGVGEGAPLSRRDEDVVVEWLARAFNHAPHEWRLAEALLGALRELKRTEDWLEWVVSSPKSRWPAEARARLVGEAIAVSRELESAHLAPLLKQQAEVLQGAHAPPARLLEAWGAYLNMRPSDRRALEAFDEVARALGEWEALAARYEAAIPARATGRVHLFELLAELYERSLDRPEEAARCWREVLALHSAHERAGQWLTLRYLSLRDWGALLETCELWRPEPTTQPAWVEARLQAQVGLGQLHEALVSWAELPHDRTRQLFLPSLLALAESQCDGPAILLLLKADRSEDDDPLALTDPLASTSGELGSVDETVAYDELISEAEGLRRAVLARDARVERRPTVSRARLRARALTHYSPLVYTFEATQAWEALFAHTPDDAEAALALVELYSSSGRRVALRGVIHRVERWCERDDICAAVVRGAQALEARFQEYAEAARCWRLVLDRSPLRAEQALAALARLASRGELWIELYEALGARVERARGYGERARALTEQAALCAGPLKRWELALEALAGLERLRPHSAEVRALYEEVVPPLGAWGALSERCRAWAEGERVGAARAERLSRVAELYEGRLSRLEEARYLYQLALGQSVGARAVALSADIARLDARLSESTAPNAPGPSPLKGPEEEA